MALNPNEFEETLEINRMEKRTKLLRQVKGGTELQKRLIKLFELIVYSGLLFYFSSFNSVNGILMTTVLLFVLIWTTEMGFDKRLNALIELLEQDKKI